MPEGVRPATWDDVIRNEAKAGKVPYDLALAVADTESGFDPTATSPKGAKGIYQLMPDTAKELGVDPDDPVQNIRGGIKYLRQMLDQHGGDVSKALTAYNWGPGNVAGGGEPPPETQAYVTRILSRLQQPGATPARLPVQTVQQSVQNIGQPPPTKGGPVATPPPASEGFVRSVMSSMDPHTRTGRRNIAGGLGDIGGTAIGTAAAPLLATVPLVGPPLAAASPAAGGAIGAGLAGGGAELTERFMGTAPPDSSLVNAAGEQAAYSVGGRLMAWPFRGMGKRMVASRVGRYASEGFDTLLTGARDALESARSLSRDAVQNATEAANVAVTGAKDRASAFLSSTKRSASEAVEKATSAGKQAVGDIADKYTRIATAPPTVTPRVAGERAGKVIAGPARQAREEIGQMVEQTAESGPDVDIKGLKQEAERILGEEIRPSQNAFPRSPAEIDPHVAELQQMADSVSKLSPEELAARSPSQRAGAQAIQDALAKAQEDQAQTVLKHPAMGVIGRILNAEDTVPFKAAHQFKRELDDAIGTAWDRSVKSKVTNITKTLRGTLRDALAVHEPYNQATAAYQAIAPLYTKGLAPALRKAAVDAPESIVRLIKPHDPTKLSMLHDLLVHQPGKVGAGNEGQFAWDSVRSAWTHENLIKGPIENIDARIAKLDPEFAHIMYGDGPGQLVLNNLKAISTAYKSAVANAAQTAAEVKAVASGAKGAARELGQQGVSATKAVMGQQTRATKDAGRQLVKGSINDLQAVRAESKKFLRSSLVRAKDESLLSDALRAGGLGIRSIWGAQSIARLILRGPKGHELTYFASHSPEGTQLLVKALTGPEAGLALSELLRLTGLGDIVSEGVGTPPPRSAVPGPNASNVGAPPP